MGTDVTIRGENALMDVERASLDVQITTAKAYPRNIAQCAQEMMAIVESLTPEDAESMNYCMPAGKENGKQVFAVGPSVRLAEIVRASWGNLRLKSTLFEPGEKSIVAESTVWDLEKNTAVSIQKPRSITGKFGRYSENLITKTQLAAQSIAGRDAIFAIVPRVIVDALARRAKEIAEAKDKDKGADERRQKLISYFAEKGVTIQMILSLFELADVSEITPKHMSDLRGIAAAIRDGVSTVAECFPEKPANIDSADKLKEALAKKTAQPSEESPPEQAPSLTPDSDHDIPNNDEAEIKALIAHLRAIKKESGINNGQFVAILKKAGLETPVGANREQLTAVIEDIEAIIAAQNGAAE